MKNVHMCHEGNEGRMKEGKIENLKKEGKIRISTFIFIYTIHFAYLKVYTKFHNPKSSSCYLKVYTKFENTGSNRRREICDRNFHWRKKDEQIKGLISNMWMFFCYTIYNSSLSSFVPLISES